jgi:hypothetical protein
VLEYRPNGLLLGVGSDRSLVLPEGRPLSYLRVRDPNGHDPTLARVLLEHRATEFRRRIPLVGPHAVDREELLSAFERFAASPVFPLLEGREGGGSEVDVCWLDRVQMLAFARQRECGYSRRTGPVLVDGLELAPTYEIDRSTDVAEVAERIDDKCQYWNSDWEFAPASARPEEWWRVRPNDKRGDERLLGLLPSAEARGTSAACLPPATLRELGNPRYLVIEHPYRNGNVPVLAIADEGLKALRGEGASGRTVYLDRTARDALGISDGEFCLVHPWLRPRRQIWRRFVRDRYVGSRAISANLKTSARADLEKPVCRLDEEALAAIGGKPSEFVTLEALHSGEPRRSGEQVEYWKRVRVDQRVVPIDAGERSRRGSWEAGQLWDDASASPRSWGGRGPTLEREGFVDCAETLGVHPAYPAVYLNFHARRQLGLGLCQPVEIRVNVLSRLATEFGNLAWLVLIGLIGTVAALLDFSIALIAVILGCTLLLLLLLRAIRATR